MASISTTESLRTEIPEEIEKELFENVMKREWEKVVNIYGKYPRTHKIKITSSGQTALHVATSEAKTQVVQELVQHIKRDSEPFDVLKLQTEKGYTPLHLAAATGRSGKRCKICIDSVDDGDKASELVRVRDKKGETPLFRAVHYGREGSFLYLHSILCDTGEDFSFCVRDDGQSILHDAIIRENFGISVEELNPPQPCTKLVPKQEVKDEAESNHLEKNTVEHGLMEKGHRDIDIESGEDSNIA